MDENRRYIHVYGPLLYLAASILIVFFTIAPLNSILSEVFPLTLLGLTFALMIRCPEAVPLWAIAIVFFLRDVFYFQPLGLEAFFVVLAMKFVQNAKKGLAATFGYEWGGFALAVLAITSFELFFGWILGVQVPNLLLLAKSLAATIVIYPVITGALSLQFGLVRPLPV